MTARPLRGYLTGWCGNGNHTACRRYWPGPCTCPCGHPPAAGNALPGSEGPRVGSLCSGYGGLDLATLTILGGRVVWHADPDPGATRVLASHWPNVPNHGDITRTNWTKGVEPVDVLTAGYPCQPDSDAGPKKGTADERWIWPAVRDAIRVLGPNLVVLENVRGHLGRGFPTVVGDLATIGYDTRWGCLPAAAVGAPHRRTRLFALAWPTRSAADPDRPRPQGQRPARPAGRRGPALGAAADTDRGPLRHQPITLAGSSGPTQPGHPGAAAADPDGYRRRERWPEPAQLQRLPDAARPGAAAAADPLGGRRQRGTPVPQPAERTGRGTPTPGSGDLAARWGIWAPAIARWETLTRPAPDPTENGLRGNLRLSARFTEWLMGLPAGWVTAIPGLTREQQLRILGNGVVPQQGAAALAWLLPDLPDTVLSGLTEPAGLSQAGGAA